MSQGNDLAARLEKLATLFPGSCNDLRAAAAAVRALDVADMVMESCEYRIEGIPDETGNIVDCVSQLRRTRIAIAAAKKGGG